VSHPETGLPGAFLLNFKNPQDLSGYTDIQFSARCIDIGSSVNFAGYMIKNYMDEGYQEDPYVYNAQNVWGICFRSLTKQRDNVVSPLQIMFRNEDIPSGQTRIIRINNIRIE
jgi:hypothetical protein